MRRKYERRILLGLSRRGSPRPAEVSTVTSSSSRACRSGREPGIPPRRGARSVAGPGRGRVGWAVRRGSPSALEGHRMTLRRIAVERLEAHLGRVLNEREFIRFKLVDALLVLREEAESGERLALANRDFEGAETCACASAFARRTLRELEA